MLMASGIGITPMRALLEDLDQRPGEVTLVYRVRSDQECILMDELNALVQARQARCFVVAGHRVSGRDSWLPQHAAHVSDAEALRLISPDIADHDVFLCGRPGWVQAARLAAVRAGAPPEQIHVESLSY
jgi:ferredoxin-NADP reductase